MSYLVQTLATWFSLCVCVCVFQDLLGSDWPASSSPAAAVVSSSSASSSSAAPRVLEDVQKAGERSAAASSDAEQTAAVGLRRLSNSVQRPAPTLINSETNVAPWQGHTNTTWPLKPCVAPDEFDDWDVDLADLDECDNQTRQLPEAAPVKPLPAAKNQPPSGSQTLSNRTLRGLSASHKTSGSPSQNPSVGHVPFPNPCSSFPSAPPKSPAVFPGFTARSPNQSSLSRTFRNPQQQQKPWTPQASPQARGLFESVSPAPSPVVSPHSLHTPILTNRLVQLVSASSKLPKKRPHSEARQPRTRRFPGPAGLLPHQVGVTHQSWKKFPHHMLQVGTKHL